MEKMAANMIPGETLRVLLVTTEEELRTQVSQALQGRAGDHQVYWIAQPQLIATRLKDLLPHIILVDDQLGGADLAQVVRQLASQAPATPILALLDAGALAAARQAVLSGARGFLIKPLVPVDLVATIGQLVAARRVDSGQAAPSADMGGRVVVYCAPKGGTGRTTTAVNSSISLHQITGKSVVMVDADYAAPALDVVLNLHDQRDISDLIPRLARLDEELIGRVLATHASGISVLLAPPPGTTTQSISLPQVQQIIAHLKRMFDWVVVDLGLPMDETAFAFLDSADRIVMTVLPEMVGLRNTRLMLDQLHAAGHPEQKVWLVLNRASIRGGVPTSDIERRLRVRVHHAVPDDQPLASLSVNRGVPLIMSHPRSAVARAMRALGGHLAEEMAPLRRRAPEARRSPLQNLLQRFRPGGRLAET
jgi:pilus assembly protein CpaE